MADAHYVLSLARVATAAFTAVIALLALRAYVRVRRRSVLALGLGTAILSAGYFAEGVLVELAGWELGAASALEAVVTLLAVLVLIWSLYLREPHTERTVRL